MTKLTSQTMNIFDDLHNRVIDVIKHLQKESFISSELDLSKIVLEVPRDPSHGDISTNSAMVLAKAAEKSPRDLATKIVEGLQTYDDIIDVNIAGPGFINMSLSPDYWRKQLAVILETKDNYGSIDLGKGEPINVEFVSVNPTGPMHAGHGRGAVLGDVISSLLTKVGYQVTREYYINDAGNQTITLARSAYLRYCQAHGQTIEESQFEGLYPGDYLIPIANDLKTKYGDQFIDQPESVWLDPIRQYTISILMECIKEDLNALGVHMDVFTSERQLTEQGGVKIAINTLKEQGNVYEGVLEKPKGHDLEDWEERPQLLFRATDYGDDCDRPLQKSDGSWTYFAGDIAYHYDKYRRGFKKMIDILGADHIGYVKRIQSATKAITDGQASIEVRTSQLVNFIESGQAVKMSKRAGTYILLRDVIDRVGRDVTRFIMLTRHQDMVMDFDFTKVVEQTKDNPIFYVQYAHARCHSVLRHGRDTFGNLDDVNTNISLLTDESELAMIKVLAMFPQQLKIAAALREPHRIANYVYEVAATFHALWNKGKDQVELRFIDPQNKDISVARLALIQATVNVIRNCFHLFGVTPVEEMR